MPLFVTPENLGTDASDKTCYSSLQAVLDAAVQQQQSTIVLGSGKYLASNLRMLPCHSNLSIEAAPGTRPHLIAGVRLSDWQTEADLVFAQLPMLNGAAPMVRALLVDGRMAERARYPETGALTHERGFLPRWMSSTAGGWDRQPTNYELTTLQYQQGDLGGWLNLADAEFTVFHQWDESTVGCAAIDTLNRIITFSSPCHHPPGAFYSPNHNPKGRHFVVHNIRQGLTRPGQWYQDRTCNRIYYRPYPGQELDKLDIIAPIYNSIIEIDGRYGAVRNITIKGLELSGCTTMLKTAGFGAADLESAINVRGEVENLQLQHLLIHDTGGTGIKVRPYLREDGTKATAARISVSCCSILRCGGSAIQIVAPATRVEDCAVIDVGLQHPSALALSVHSNDGEVAHCLVAGCPYTALHGSGLRMRFASNVIFDFMRQLDDGAAIYTFAGNHTVHYGNLTLGSSGRLAHAYYLDEQSQHSVVEHNVAINTRWPSHNHMAHDCMIRHNLFIDANQQMITLMKCRDFTFANNTLTAGGSIEIHATAEGIKAAPGNRISSQGGDILLVRLGADGYGREDSLPLAWQFQAAPLFAKLPENWQKALEMPEIIAALPVVPGPRQQLPHQHALS